MDAKHLAVRWAAAGLIIAVTLVGAAPVFAQSGTQSGDVIVIDQDSPDDLYLAGRDITVNAKVDGDLVVVGQTVVVNGMITGDVIFAGQSLVINGSVEDDLRAAGMIVKIGKGGSVGDDVNFAGYTFEMSDGTSLGGKFYGVGSMVTLADVAQDVSMTGNSLRVNGVVGGDVKASLGGGGPAFDPATFMGPNAASLPDYTRIPEGLTFGGDGHIDGGLDYSADHEFNVLSDAVGGKVTFTQEARSDVTQRFSARQGDAARDLLGAAVRTVGRAAVSFVLLLLIGLGLQRFAPNFLNRSVTALKTRLGASFGYGILGYAVCLAIVIGLFVVFLLLLIPLLVVGGAGPFAGLIGILGGGTLVGFWVLTDWVAPLVVALLIGGLVMQQINREGQSPFWALLVGLIAVIALRAVPIAGALVGLAIGIVGLGAVIVTRFPAKPLDVASAPAKATSAEPESVNTQPKKAAKKAEKTPKKP